MGTLTNSGKLIQKIIDLENASGGSEIVYCSLAEYNALPSTKLTDGKNYFVYDSSNNVYKIIHNGTQYGFKDEVAEISIEGMGLVSYVAVGGGGGGGSHYPQVSGGGGGGGSIKQGFDILPGGTYCVIVGCGGTNPGIVDDGNGGRGGSSCIYNTSTGKVYGIAIGGYGGSGCYGGASGDGNSGGNCGRTNNFGCGGGGGGAGAPGGTPGGGCGKVAMPMTYGGSILCCFSVGGNGASGYSYNGSCTYGGGYSNCLGSGGQGGGGGRCSQMSPTSGKPGIVIIHSNGATIRGGTECDGMHIFTSNGTFTIGNQQ